MFWQQKQNVSSLKDKMKESKNREKGWLLKNEEVRARWQRPFTQPISFYSQNVIRK